MSIEHVSSYDQYQLHAALMTQVVANNFNHVIIIDVENPPHVFWFLPLVAFELTLTCQRDPLKRINFIKV